MDFPPSHVLLDAGALLLVFFIVQVAIKILHKKIGIHAKWTGFIAIFSLLIGLIATSSL